MCAAGPRTETAVIDTLTIESKKAAAALEHPRSRQIILDMVPGARSLQELADATGLSLSLLHYHVKRLQRFGLIRVVRKDKRAGRSVNRYRAVARRFLVPGDLATHGGGAALLRELRAGLDRARARGDNADVVYFVDAAGVPRMLRRPLETKRSAFEVWFALFLTPHDIKALSGELRAMFGRYSQRSSTAAQPVIGYCAFAPRISAPGWPRAPTA
jgi:DNA-binding transcriptional ArsR family regulator